mmetsp:Transcript_4452/g.6658  ORF Transcript_4452/g.6658 Transcript_4452/m.6658 type:complete len:656 (+) Transcript_4452:20-1987(+)
MMAVVGRTMSGKSALLMATAALTVLLIGKISKSGKVLLENGVGVRRASAVRMGLNRLVFHPARGLRLPSIQSKTSPGVDVVCHSSLQEIPEPSVSSDEWPRWTTRQIMQHTKASGVLKFAEERIDDINEIHIVAVLSKIAYLDRDFLRNMNANQRQVWQELWGKLEIFAPGLDAKGISSLLKSATKLKYIPGNSFLLSIQEQAMNHVEGFGAQDCISFWEAFANFEIQPEEELMMALNDQLLDRIDELHKHKQVTTAIWALKKLDYEPSPELLHGLYSRKLGLPERKISERIIKAPDVPTVLRIATDNLQLLSGRDVATCISKISKTDPKCLRERHLEEEDLERVDLLFSLLPMVIPRLTCGGLVILLTSLARLGVPPEDEVMEAWKQRITEVAGELSAHDIATSMWAFAVLQKIPPTEVLSSFANRVDLIAASFNSHDYTNAFWALATFSRSLQRKISHRKPISSGSADEAVEIVGAEEDSEVGDVDKEMLGYIQRMQAQLQRTSVDAAEDFGPKPLARILWSFAKEGQMPREDLMMALVTRLSHLIDRAPVEDVSLISWSLARLQYSPSQELFRSILASCKKFTPEAQMREIRTMRWAVPVLESKVSIDAADVIALLDTRASELMSESSPDGVPASDRGNSEGEVQLFSSSST